MPILMSGPAVSKPVMHLPDEEESSLSKPFSKQQFSMEEEDTTI
jgi:hypothetical protein